MTNHLGDLLFSIRRKRRLLQKQVAANASIDASYLTGLERGRRDAPTAEVIDRLLSALQATDSERARVQHALTVARLDRVISKEPFPLPGAEVLVRLAEQLPRLDADQLQLLETFVDLMSRADQRKEETMA